MPKAKKVVKPVLTPRKLAAWLRRGKIAVGLDTGRFTCSVCGRKERGTRAYDPRNFSSGDRVYCRQCGGWTVPRIEFDTLVLDLVTDSRDRTPVLPHTALTT